MMFSSEPVANYVRRSKFEKIYEYGCLPVVMTLLYNIMTLNMY